MCTIIIVIHQSQGSYIYFNDVDDCSKFCSDAKYLFEIMSLWTSEDFLTRVVEKRACTFDANGQ